MFKGVLPYLRALGLLSTLALTFVGCGSQGDGGPTPPPGHAPDLQIISPVEDAILYPGTTAWQFEAITFDQEDTNPVQLSGEMTLWRGGLEVISSPLVPQADGHMIWRLNMRLEQGDYQLSVEVTDRDGMKASLARAFSVRNLAPQVSILSPSSPASLYQNLPIEVVAQIFDTDTPVDVPLEVSMVLGSINYPSVFVLPGGVATFEFTPPSVGYAVLEIRARDELGGLGRGLLEMQISACADFDQDGIWSCPQNGAPSDCDDTDALVQPGAEERCNGKDDDCDGVVPEEEADADGDGGRPCSDDCNEADPTVYAGATERCDGLDNNCDLILPPAEIDGDGDGYVGCSGPLGPADCDDARVTVYPGAAEICDGLDNDCSGTAGTDEVDKDLDGWLLCAGDCNDDAYYTYPGAIERLDFQDNDCDGNPEGDLKLSSANARFSGVQAEAQVGTAVASGADLSGEGLDDLAIGAPRFNATGSSGSTRGGTFLILGRSTGWRSQENQTVTRGITLHESEASARSGTAVGVVRDLNGDGLGELLVGAPGHIVNNASEAGGVYVVAGRREWVNAELSSISLTLVEGVNSGMNLGTSVSSAGDFNGDGTLEVALGAPWSTRRPTSPGLIALLGAKSFGWSSRTSVNTLYRVNGVENQAIGVSLAVGRPTPDKLDDVIIGGLLDPGANQGLAVWLPGTASIRSTGQSSTAALEAKNYLGDTSSERVGSSVSSGADLDGDGLDEVAVGRGQNGASTDAAAYIIFGASVPPTSGSIETSQVSQVRFVRGASDECPCTVQLLPDFDGDGIGDLAIGVAKGDSDLRDVGRIYLFRGRRSRASWPSSLPLSDADGVLIGETEREQAGYALGVGDLNGDGSSDLIIGAPYATVRDSSGANLSNAGRVYVILGVPGAGG